MELYIAELIARLKLSVIIELLLHSIVGEMHKPVGDILEGELPATGPEIAIGIPVALQVAIDRAHEREASDIELTVLVQQRLLNILLYDVGTLYAIHSRVLDKTLDVVQVFAHLDAAPSVCVFARLHDPELLSELGQLV